MPNGRTTACVFCGRKPPEIKLTREHILRSWFDQFFGVEGGGSEYRSVHRVGDTDEYEFISRATRTGAWQNTVKRVCEQCNRAVLNDQIERPVENELLAMMRGEAIELSQDMLHGIALWASKTAMVRALLDQGESAIPSVHYRYLRDNLTPPPMTTVYLGHCVAAPDTWHRHRRFKHQLGTSVHETTFVLGEMLLIIVGIAGPDGRDAPEELVVDVATTHQETMVALSRGALVQIHPPSDATRFPPGSQIDDEFRWWLSEAVQPPY